MRGGRGRWSGGRTDSGGTVPSKQWVRPTTSKEEVYGNEKKDPVSPSSEALGDGPVEKTSSAMVKRGPHQLVKTEQSGPNETLESKASGNEKEKNSTQVEEEIVSRTGSDQEGPTSNSQVMKRVGRNKLILGGQKKQDSDSKPPAGGKVSTFGAESESERRKDHSGEKSQMEHKQWKGSHHPSTAPPFKSHRLKKRRSPSQFHDRRPAAQRVRLSNPEQKVEQSREGSEDDAESPNESNMEASERLSDFAYHQAGRTIRQFQHRTWKPGDNSNPNDSVGPRKMSLVRAKQDKAPICPTYARGIECTDKFCRKRHDVPKEAAVPFCSFFQRNGQCFKDDCKFRHIKINPRATICPSFALLGYCEDKECTMKHSRPSPKEKDKKPPPVQHRNWKYVREA